MNVLTRLRQQIANYIDPKTQIVNKFNEAFLWGMGGGGYTTYDEKMDDYIDLGYNINPIVYSIVNQQAVKTSTIPFYVKKIEDENALKNLDRFRMVTKMHLTAQQKVQLLLMESKAFQDETMPFPLDRPNVNQNWSEFLALYKTFLKTTGNVYIYMLTVEGGPEAGKPLAIYLLPSQYIQILVKENADYLALESPVKGYMLIEGNAYMEFEAENVIHIKYSNPNYDVNGAHLYGQAPLRSALKNIMSSNAALDLNIRTLKSGGAFGFIHGKGSPIQPEQAQELKERLVEMNNNPENLGKVAGVSAEMGFTRISLTSDELKPFDFLNFDQKMIANVLGWSDKLLNNDSGSKYDNINEERKRMITDNIVPDLKLLEDALNNYFIPRFKGYDNTRVEFDVMELPEMQDDAAELSGWLYNGIDKAVFNRDEVRKALRWPEIGSEEMARFTVQNDVISLDEALDNDFSTMPNGSQGGPQDGTGPRSEDPDYVPKKKVDTEDKAGFDPNQPRDKDGKWGSGYATSLDKLKEENRSTLPKVRTGKVFENDVESLSHAERVLVDDIIDNNKIKDLPIETVSISDIVPTQRNITIGNLSDTIGAALDNDDEAILFKKGGRYYILDGHHRIANRILEGDKTVDVRTFDSGK